MILRFLTLAVCGSISALLCRFTVRDVGFVDLGDPNYQCYVIVTDGDSGGSSSLRRAAKSVFADTNIEFELVETGSDEDHVVHRHLRELKIDRFPATVLVHPDGQATELPIGGDFEQVATEVLETVADSDLRQRITDAVLRHYCVVLVIEGANVGKNQAAHAAVQTAFKAIEKVFDQMPKDVGALPLSITVPQTEQASEKVLLWSLGIQGVGADPSVAVLTGRGRRFGSVLEGASINEDSVLGILSKVGESCECGLDRSWMRGVRIPLRWDVDTRQTATDILGFDPDNPLVKAEMSSIIAKGRNGHATKQGAEPTVADLLLGYSEISVEEGLEIETEPVDASVSEQESESSGLGSTIWVTLVGLIVANFVIALLVFWRVRRG